VIPIRKPTVRSAVRPGVDVGVSAEGSGNRWPSVWITFADDQVRVRLPAKLRGSSPPVVHHATFDSARLPMLRDFLGGRSNRLRAKLRQAVTLEDVPAFMRRTLERDLEAAEEFYNLGPHALWRLRLSHGLPAS